MNTRKVRMTKRKMNKRKSRYSGGDNAANALLGQTAEELLNAGVSQADIDNTALYTQSTNSTGTPRYKPVTATPEPSAQENIASVGGRRRRKSRGNRRSKSRQQSRRKQSRRR